MIESPVLQEFVREREQAAAEKAAKANTIKNILTILVVRFGPDAQGLKARLDRIASETRLDEPVRQAATAPDLEAFVAFLAKKR